MTINAIIADDHELVREAPQVRLQRMDVQIVAEAINGQQVVDLAASVDFDLILMDISMPVINGVEATHQIKQANPTCKILVLTWGNMLGLAIGGTMPPRNGPSGTFAVVLPNSTEGASGPFPPFPHSVLWSTILNDPVH